MHLGYDDKLAMTTTCTKVDVLTQGGKHSGNVQILIMEKMRPIPILFVALLCAGHCAARWVTLRGVASTARCRVSRAADATMTMPALVVSARVTRLKSK